MEENYYKILGINENSSQDEIKKKYRSLSLKYHPDRNQSNEAVELYKKINEAYEVLGDTQKREQYDMSRRNPFMRQMNGGNPFNDFNDLNEIFDTFFGSIKPQGMPFNPFFGNSNGNSNGNIRSVGIPEIHIFHNGIPIPIHINQQLEKPSPIIKNIDISFSQSYTGLTIPIEIERWIHDNGSKVFETEILQVNIPSGVENNEQIVLKEKGNILNERIKGDVKLLINITNNTEYQRNGLDCIYNKSITLKEALCGFSFQLNYIDGKIYTLNNSNANIIIPGYNKIIPNMGFTRNNDNDNIKGNLIIVFHVIFPEKLTEEQINGLKEIL
jgi:DnaJ-class molecular chaperone